VGLYLSAKQIGILENTDPQSIRAAVEAWGLWGIALYVAFFSLGLFLYVPGTVFIIAAGLAYGQAGGVVVAMLGANVAVNVSFCFVRLVGGTPFETHSNPLLERLLRGLHSSPVINITIMRFLGGTSPGLNYLLALSSVTPQQHFLGSLAGMIIPVGTVAFLADWLVVKLF
jgi:uncharacterized membrane protein YdjX (TVP38/TMEM64 family)